MKKYKLTGKVYGVEQHFYAWDEEKKYPRYEEIARIELGIFEFEKLSQAEEFFNENYKHLQAGGSIVQVDADGKSFSGGDFILYPVKGF